MKSRIERRRDDLLGKEFETNNCGKCFVIDYKGKEEVLVMFYEPMFVVTCALSSLKRGNVSNPFYPTVNGVGYLGVGDYNQAKNPLVSTLWRNMLKRSYDESFHKKHPSYRNTTICKEWQNFQNFAEWCYSQKFFNAKDNKGSSYHLDKDILRKDNKIYSPETCCFIPQDVNKLLLKSNAIRGKYPIGVNLSKQGNSFVSTVTCENKSKFLGEYKTPEEAFLVYKQNKEWYIKEVAEKWRGKIGEAVYEALLQHEVHIDD